MPDRSPDKELARRLLAHEEAAFSEFFEAYFERLYRFAKLRLNGDGEAARDVTQLTLTRALQRLSSYRGEAGFYTWLCTICRNQVIDYLRRENRHSSKVELIEDSEEVRGALESLDLAGAGDPDAHYQRGERARLIAVALDHLPARYGDALEWKYIYGYSTREIAERLDMGREAAQSLLARARRAFHDAYRALTPPASGDLDSSTPGSMP